MRFFCIYDNLYEEYQNPFVMKNSNIAKIEFEQFVNSMVDKAPEKEKENTRKRFLLCEFKNIEYHSEKGLMYVNDVVIPADVMDLSEEY